MAGRFSVEAVFKAIDKVTAPVSRMQNRVGKFTRSMSRGFNRLNKGVNKFGRGLKRGAMIATGALALTAVALTSLVGTGADFEQAITNVGAVAMKTRAEIAPLEQMALKLGRTTKFTATQAADAMEILSRAGFNTQQVLQATPAILSAAAASGLEIAEVANHVSNALKGMGLDVSKAANVADVLALASSRTNSTIGSLGESLSNVASTARQLKIPFTEVTAAVALLQDVGLDASVAGSAFNTMLTKMAAPTAGITKKMRRFGISFKDVKGDMLPLQKVLEQLSIAGKKAGGNFDKVAFLAELVGLRGQKAASNLATLFETGKITDLVKELENAEGAADKMARLRMDTVQGSFLLLKSAIDGVKVSVFNMNSGPLKDLIDKTTAWVSANEKLIASNIGGFLGDVMANLSGIVDWIKRIGTGLAIFGALTVVLKTLIGILTIVNLLVAANPITLMVVSVVALIAAFTALTFWIDDIAEAFDNMPGAIRAVLLPIELLVRAIKFIKDNIGFVASAASSLFGLGGDDAEDEANQNQAGVRQMISPQARVASSIEEQRTTSTAEVTLKTEPGTSAEVTQGKVGGGLVLQETGAF